MGSQHKVFCKPRLVENQSEVGTYKREPQWYPGIFWRWEWKPFVVASSRDMTKSSIICEMKIPSWPTLLTRRLGKSIYQINRFLLQNVLFWKRALNLPQLPTKSLTRILFLKLKPPSPICLKSARTLYEPPLPRSYIEPDYLPTRTYVYSQWTFLNF